MAYNASMTKKTPPRRSGRALAPDRDRMHLRVSSDVKEMLEEAAALVTGGDVTAFVVGAATERARRVLSDVEVTRIEGESRQRFYELMMNPPEPSPALKRLLADDAFDVRR